MTWCLLALALSPLIAFGILVVLRDLRTLPLPPTISGNGAGQAPQPRVLTVDAREHRAVSQGRS